MIGASVTGGRSVRIMTDADLRSAIEIVRGLPDYFTDDVPEKVPVDWADGTGWVVESGSSVVGFAVVRRQSAAVAEIVWMAVAGARRGEGAGSVLLDAVVDELGADGVRVIEVKTLDASADYPPYVGTRAFWERHGFVQVDTVDPMPGWQPGNPAAVYVAALRPTR